MLEPSTRRVTRIIPMRRARATAHVTAVYPRSSCGSCSLKNGCLPRALRDGDLDAFSTMARLKRNVRRGAALFCAGDELTAVYVLRSGTFKTVTLSNGGQPKITAFFLPGDLLGLEAISEGAHAFDAVALENSEVCVLPLGQLESMATELPAVQKELMRALSTAIVRDQRLLLLGCMDAEQRVTRLLLGLAERYGRLGYASDGLLLHMTRDEIASYLCLSSETVSRVISRLRRKGLLTVNQRHIGFVDSAKLIETSAW